MLRHASRYLLKMSTVILQSLSDRHLILKSDHDYQALADGLPNERG